MKKRLFSIVLAGALLFQTVPVLASEDIDPIHSVNFATIRAEVEERNPVINANMSDYEDGQDSVSATLKMLIKQEEFVDATIAGITHSAYFEVVIKDYECLPDDIKGLIADPKTTSVPVITKNGDSTKIYGISTSKNSAGNPIWFILPQAGPSETNIAVDTQNSTVDLSPALRSMYLNIVSLYESQIMTLDAQYKSVVKSKGESWKYIINLKQGTDQMVWAAQQLILSYNSLQEKLQTLSVQQRLLIRQRELAELQVQLGLITAIDQTNVEASLNDLNFGMKSLTQGMDSVKENLNIILGQEYNNSLAIESVVVLDKKTVQAMDYDRDLDQAMDKSFNVFLAYNEDGEDRTEQNSKKDHSKLLSIKCIRMSP